MKLPRRAKCCCKGNEPFEPGSIYYSRILVDGTREDFCERCWEKGGEYWQGQIPEKKELTPDKQALELFKNEPKFRPLLALYLERRKEIASRAQLSKGGKKCYEILETGELIHVEKTPVDESSLKEVMACLENSLPSCAQSEG